MRRTLIALGVVLGTFASPPTIAQTYPSKPIRLLVPYPPGGGTDLAARALAPHLQEGFGQPVLVENRPGASEIIGTEATVRSAPDGYTLGLFSNALAINVTLVKQLPYALDDMQPVLAIAEVPFMMVVNPSVAATNVRELIALAKERPGRLNYASLGPGSPHGMAMEWFKHLAQVNIEAVPYKGLAPAMTAVTAGEAQVMLTGLTAGIAQVKAGKLRAIAVTPAKGVASLPDLAPVARDLPEFDLGTWYGIGVPRGTPKGVVSRIHAEFAKALDAPDVRARFGALGITAERNTPEQFGARLRSEVELWSRIIKATGARATD